MIIREMESSAEARVQEALLLLFPSDFPCPLLFYFIQVDWRDRWLPFIGEFKFVFLFGEITTSFEQPYC